MAIKRVEVEGVSEVMLQEGDIVVRMLMDGDAVLVNRQPTLSQTSILLHTVKVKTTDPQDFTISLNVGVFGLFGADCDGDEVNIYTSADGKHSRLNTVEDCIWSVKTGRLNLSHG